MEARDTPACLSTTSFSQRENTALLLASRLLAHLSPHARRFFALARSLLMSDCAASAFVSICCAADLDFGSPSRSSTAATTSGSPTVASTKTSPNFPPSAGGTNLPHATASLYGLPESPPQYTGSGQM